MKGALHVPSFGHANNLLRYAAIAPVFDHQFRAYTRRIPAKPRGQVDLVVLIVEKSEKTRQVTVFSRHFAIGMVWLVTAICGISFFATTIPDEGYLRAFGWGAVMAGAMFVVGRLGVWLFWDLDEDQGRRRE